MSIYADLESQKVVGQRNACPYFAANISFEKAEVEDNAIVARRSGVSLGSLQPNQQVRFVLLGLIFVSNPARCEGILRN